jgi:hypothetical protein
MDVLRYALDGELVGVARTETEPAEIVHMARRPWRQSRPPCPRCGTDSVWAAEAALPSPAV